jgi:dihydrofolate reductase
MGKLVVFEWMSLNGVFDADTMSEWWEPYDSEDRRRRILETYSYADALLMGRVTYEMLAPYWSGLEDDEMSGLPGALNHTHKYVVSSRPPGTSWQNSTVIGDRGDDITAAIQKVRQERAETVCIGSGTLVIWLMQADLVDEYKFLVQPVIAGRGKGLFTEGVSAKMRIVASQELDQGVLFLHYQRGDTARP